MQWAQGLGINAVTELPQVGDGSTVLIAAADVHNSQTLYLWEEGNVPATTEYTQNNGNYSDDPDFRPYLVSFLVPEGTEVKGAVLICAGGAFQFRRDRWGTSRAIAAGWPGHVMKDMKKVCKGAAFAHEMKVQFDSSGGSELATEDAKIEAWIEQIK